MSVRPEDDFYETPEYATEKLLEHEVFHGRVWEPACGYGAISNVLCKHNYPTYSTDITYRQYGDKALDFLSDHNIL